jgi:hypothetical protein
MNVLVSGGTGLVGSSLIPALRRTGHDVSLLTRRAMLASPGGVPSYRWDPRAGTLDDAALGGVGAIVHLAGESIARGLWTKARRRRILESRVFSTRLLAERAAALPTPPSVFVSASAIGYYGNRGDEIMTEESATGSGFLAQVSREWEAAAAPALARGIRVVFLRIGLVLDGKGGALGAMLPIFRLGLGGPMGNGRQWVSWVALEDLVGAITLALSRDDLSGPVNVVAPEPARNREFARAIGHALGRPALLPAPAFALKLLLGAMAEEALLSSTRVSPSRLLAAGYAFRFPSLTGALENVIAPSSARSKPSAKG